MPRPPPRSFLLRLWRERAGAPLRATLVPVTQPAAQRHFATLDALQAYLRAADEGSPEPDERELPDCTPSKTH